MSELIAYSNTTDGRLFSWNADYLTARAGSNLSVLTADTADEEGQYLSGSDKVCMQSFLEFDTGLIPDDATINTVTLELYGSEDSSTTDFILEARLHDWGGSLETTDFVPGADLAAKTLLASRDTASGWSISAYNTLTSEAAFLANINKTGYTRLVLASSRQRIGTAPTTYENVGHLSGDSASNKPKLTITYTSGERTVGDTLGATSEAVARVGVFARREHRPSDP